MKTIGLLGGMSWESTAPYYRLINQEVAARLGGLHSAPLVLYSVDFHHIERLQRAGAWAELAERLGEAAARLEAAGAECLVLCTNTLHRIAPALEGRLGIPLLHIADATAAALRASGVRRAGLLGTRYTMEADFYRGRLAERHGLEVLIPEEAERALIHRIIYEELCVGRLEQDSRAALQRITQRLAGRGAEAVVLACTELGLLLAADDAPVPIFDTTALHARAAVDWALAGADRAADAHGGAPALEGRQ